ncbi:MAG: proteasome accessory factor PafA2 family protein, partial [Acidimicrobiales bacterium]
MALHKILGIETEFGIIVRGAGESNPIAASSVLINAYVHELARAGAGHRESPKVGWDFEDEHPDIDARGFTAEGSLPPEVETHLVNAVLTNGARYYVDHAHPELSSPECADPRSAVVFDKAAEIILQRSMRAARDLLPEGQEIVVYKNNSDRKGNSYGCHENYLMDRQVPFSRIVTHVMPHFVSRQVFTGAGKVGTEVAGLTSDDVPFQLTQRADFFEEEVGLETTLKRPIVNTRDEPHADAQKYRRLHVIVGDANLSEVATFLKVGTTALVLSMIEDDWLARDLVPARPVQALRQVSYDLTLAQPIELADGTSITALEVQWELLDRARKWAESRGLEAVGEEVGRDVLHRWEDVLAALESDPMTLANPVQAHRFVSYDLTVGRPLELANGKRMTALEIQWEQLDRARK